MAWKSKCLDEIIVSELYNVSRGTHHTIVSCSSPQAMSENTEKVIGRAQYNFLNLKKKIFKNITYEINRLDR